MTPHQIVVVILRLVAMVWLIHTLTHMYGLFTVFEDGSGVSLSRSVVSLSAVFQVFVCLALWFFPSTIAANLLRSGQPAHEPALPRPMIEWQILGIILVGIWALVQAIPDAVYWVTYYAMVSGSNLSFFDLDPDQKANALATVVQLVIGTGLLMGAKRFASVLFRSPAAGESKDPRS